MIINRQNESWTEATGLTSVKHLMPGAYSRPGVPWGLLATAAVSFLFGGLAGLAILEWLR